MKASCLSGASVAALLAAALSACSTPPLEGPRQLRLVTWNIEHLAERDGAGCRPRVQADYQRLRAIAEELNADVVAFQEVENESAAERVFDPGRWNIIMSSRPSAVREGFCRDNKGPRILKQDVGFAIRKGLSVSRNPDLHELGLGSPDLRWGVDVRINLPQPIRLLAVHLKSGCNVGRSPADRDCDVLFSQAQVLEEWIDDRARAAEDFAIMGDWNRRAGLAGDAFVAQVSDDDPPAGRLIFATQGQDATCLSRYSDFIDHIAIGAQAAHRIVLGSFTEHRYQGLEEDFPSDHCPQSVVIRSGR